LFWKINNTTSKIKEYLFAGDKGMNNFEINIQYKIMILAIYNICCEAGEVSGSKYVLIEK
jgi:hypothetical protein